MVCWSLFPSVILPSASLFPVLSSLGIRLPGSCIAIYPQLFLHLAFGLRVFGSRTYLPSLLILSHASFRKTLSTLNCAEFCILSSCRDIKRLPRSFLSPTRLFWSPPKNPEGAKEWPTFDLLTNVVLATTSNLLASALAPYSLPTSLYLENNKKSNNTVNSPQGQAAPLESSDHQKTQIPF